MAKYPEQNLKTEWIYDGITPDAVEWTQSFGEFLTKKQNEIKPLTTGQLRKFFGEIKRIESNVEKYQNDIAMLKPLLAYAVGRDTIKYNKKGQNIINNKTHIKEFAEEVEKGIDAVLNGKNLKSDFNNFVKIIEAIVAYHKYYGGQENNN